MTPEQTRAHLAGRFGLDLSVRSPIEIRNTNRVTLAQLFAELDFTRGVEVGVESGEYSEVLCKANPGLKLYCVDMWQPYPGYRDHVSATKLQGFYETTQTRLAPYYATLIRKFSMAAVQDFEDGSLDFVYLDAAHDLRNVIDDLSEWSKKIRPGGILSGHDYVRHRLPDRIQVVQAVNAWTDSYEIAPWFLLGSQAKVEGELRDTSRSWFWVHDPPPAYRRKKPVHQ